jgi:hypothetical protein
MLGEEPARCQFMRLKFHVTNPGIESGPPTERTVMSYSFMFAFQLCVLLVFFMGYGFMGARGSIVG